MSAKTIKLQKKVPDEPCVRQSIEIAEALDFWKSMKAFYTLLRRIKRSFERQTNT
jgi:hypothetical protein